MKISNEYAEQIPEYDAIPKTVLAALAYSFAIVATGDEDPERAIRLLITEWDILHNGAIVPQPVPARLRSLIIPLAEI